MSQVKKAEELIEDLFADIKERNGRPYTEHLYRVSAGFNDDSKKAAALLHDVIEDTDMTAAILLSKGFSEEVVEAVQLLTNNHETYDEYIDYLINCSNVGALEIKKADLEDNMNLDRLPVITDNDLKRQDKYKKAYQKIIDELNKEKYNDRY